jgi:predicted nucleic acid-binding Zn ribbon protein
MESIIALPSMATRFESLSGAITSLIERLHLTQEMTLYQLASHWEEIVGPQIALHTVPETLRFDTISISVDSAPWMNQLTFLKKGIIKNINTFLHKNQVREILFRLAPRATPSSKKEMPYTDTTIQSAPIMPDLEAALKDVPSATMRRQIETALAGYFKK